MENIPPTSDALLQHAKRATYQASLWTSSHNSQQNQSTPDSWDWNWDELDKDSSLDYSANSFQCMHVVCKMQL